MDLRSFFERDDAGDVSISIDAGVGARCASRRRRYPAPLFPTHEGADADVDELCNLGERIAVGQTVSFLRCAV